MTVIRDLYIKNVSGGTLDFSSCEILVDDGTIDNNEEKIVRDPQRLDGCQNIEQMIHDGKILFKLDDGSKESAYTVDNSLKLIAPSYRSDIVLNDK